MPDTQTDNTTIQELFAAGAHVGYSRSRRHPSTAPYIFTRRNQTEVIDLEQTATLLATATTFVEDLGRTGKTILFVGGKPEARHAVQRAAESIDQPYVTGRWIGGTLTNFPEIKKRIDELVQLREQRDSGELAQKYTKLERLMIDRNIARLNERFGGLVGMTKRPDALFVVDPQQEQIAVAEARKTQLPIVALANSDCNLSQVTYPIVANDTLQSSITYVTDAIAAAYRRGLQGRTSASAQPTETAAA